MILPKNTMLSNKRVQNTIGECIDELEEIKEYIIFSFSRQQLERVLDLL